MSDRYAQSHTAAVNNGFFEKHNAKWRARRRPQKAFILRRFGKCLVRDNK